MIITHKINMDMIRRGIVPRIHTVQGDALTRQVEISLFADGISWQIPGTPAVLIRYRRPDRVSGVYDTLPDGTAAGSTKGSAVTIAITREVLAVPGDVILVVTLVDGGRELSTFEFILAVQPNHSRDIFSGAEQASVTGMLPAPDSARPGQILVIEEVDEYGLIRRMKADDALPGTTITQISLDENQADQAVSRYLITMNDGSVHAFEVNHGKSAYAYAQEAGYSGTEQEFALKLAGDASLIHIGSDAPGEEEVCLWIDTDATPEAVAPSDWNAAEGEAGHVLNRTHHAHMAENEIFPETVLSWSEEDYGCCEVNISAPLVIGRQYRVFWDGTEYVRDAVSFNGSPMLGNISFLDSTYEDQNTGEPFALMYEEDSCWLYTETFLDDAPPAGSAVVQIIEIAEVVHQLARKYIPAMSYVITDASDGVVNESYDNFSDILWAGGSVFVRVEVNGTYIMYAVTSAAWHGGVIGWSLYCENFGASKSYTASNGTWTPPVV